VQSRSAHLRGKRAHVTGTGIGNAMLTAETVRGVNGYRVAALPRERLREIMSVSGAPGEREGR